MKGFALRLVLKKRHKRTRNWPIKTATSSRSFSIFSSNSWWEMCSSGNRTRSFRPDGKYRSIRHTKISEIQTGITRPFQQACYSVIWISFLFHDQQLSQIVNVKGIQSLVTNSFHRFWRERFKLAQTKTLGISNKYFLNFTFLGGRLGEATCNSLEPKLPNSVKSVTQLVLCQSQSSLKISEILTDSKGRGRIFLVGKTLLRNCGCTYEVVNLIGTGLVTTSGSEGFHVRLSPRPSRSIDFR